MKISDLLSQIETYMKAGSLTPDSEVSIELLVNFRNKPIPIETFNPNGFGVGSAGNGSLRFMCFSEKAQAKPNKAPKYYLEIVKTDPGGSDE